MVRPMKSPVGTSTDEPADRHIPTVEAVAAMLRECIAAGNSANPTAADIDEHTPLLDGGIGLDSIMIVELISDIELRLGFEFHESDLRTNSFQSLVTLAQVIVARLQNTGGCA